jgi:hypothetical protein
MERPLGKFEFITKVTVYSTGLKTVTDRDEPKTQIHDV